MVSLIFNRFSGWYFNISGPAHLHPSTYTHTNHTSTDRYFNETPIDYQCYYWLVCACKSSSRKYALLVWFDLVGSLEVHPQEKLQSRSFYGSISGMLITSQAYSLIPCKVFHKAKKTTTTTTTKTNKHISLISVDIRVHYAPCCIRTIQFVHEPWYWPKRVLCSG